MKETINLKDYVYDYIRDGKKYELKKIIFLLDALGNPQDDFRTIHITGTNGKGSTSTFLESILYESGFNVGKFTSPHLIRYNERIRINQKEIDNDDLSKILPDLEEAVDKTEKEFSIKPSFFEMMTAMAFLFFSRKKVDYAVVEVGLGGRLDATNTVKDSLSVITSIDKDHTGILGKTMTAITREKAGIIKKDSKCVSGVQRPHLQKIIIDRCKEQNTSLYTLFKEFRPERSQSDRYGTTFDYVDKENRLESIRINMPGFHQVKNASLAIKVSELLNIESKYIIKGLKEASFDGRLEFLSKQPDILIDGAHNRSGTDALYDYLRKNWSKSSITVLCTILRDKDADHFYKYVGEVASNIIID